jgi:REP element-mobilizing transposase RayT
MRRARITYEGATHHVMNRGHSGINIFPDDKCKNHFLRLLGESIKSTGIVLYAYCIMDNHYHLIVQNTNGKMSQLMKLLNGQYGTYFRHRFGGKGYIFQNRFHSTLIQEDSHLTKALIYLLLNPERAGIVTDCQDYKWSSYHEYFSKVKTAIVDKKIVEGMFAGKRNLDFELRAEAGRELKIQKTRYGDISGSSQFAYAAIEKFERRKNKDEDTKSNKRYRDPLENLTEDVIREFELKIGMKISEINSRKLEGKKCRARLLVDLREKAGLTLSEIAHMKLFRDVKYSSLSSIYKNEKGRNIIG